MASLFDLITRIFYIESSFGLLYRLRKTLNFTWSYCIKGYSFIFYFELIALN